MHKLIVNPGTDQSWEIPLTEGDTTLGSDPALPCPITHESVSPAHCQVTVAGAQVTLQDLGSTCGTFLDHEPANNSKITSGQTIQLGEVDLQFLSDSAVGPLSSPRRIAPSVCGAQTSQNPSCKFHGRAFATWHCQPCLSDYCDLCVNVRRVGDSVRHLCRKCGNDCSPLEVTRPTPPAPENFYSALPRAFSYPFKGNGIILIISGGVFFTALGLFMGLARYAFLLGLVVMIGCALFIVGFLFSYLKTIIAATGQGEDDPPDWPEFSDWSADIMSPAFQAFCLVVISFGPAIALHWWHPLGEDHPLIPMMVMLFVGALFAPMGMLALGIFDSLAALNPVTIVRSISRIPLPYLVAAAAFESILLTYFVLAQAAGSLGVPGFLLRLVLSIVELYALMVAMRTLGLLYRTQKTRLGWP